MITSLRDTTSEDFSGFVGVGGANSCYHSMKAYDYDNSDDQQDDYTNDDFLRDVYYGFDCD